MQVASFKLMKQKMPVFSSGSKTDNDGCDGGDDGNDNDDTVPCVLVPRLRDFAPSLNWLLLLCCLFLVDTRDRQTDGRRCNTKMSLETLRRDVLVYATASFELELLPTDLQPLQQIS